MEFGGREAEIFIGIEEAFSEILEPHGTWCHTSRVAMFLPLEALLPFAFFCSQAGLNLEWHLWSVTRDCPHCAFLNSFLWVVGFQEWERSLRGSRFLRFLFQIRNDDVKGGVVRLGGISSGLNQ